MDDRPGTEKAEGSKDCHAPLIPFRPLFTDSTHFHSFTNGITSRCFSLFHGLYTVQLWIVTRTGKKGKLRAGCSSCARPCRRIRRGGEPRFQGFKSHHHFSKFSMNTISSVFILIPILRNSCPKLRQTDTISSDTI